MEVRELVIIGIHMRYCFGVGKEQREYIEEELKENSVQYEMGDNETILRVRKKNVPNFNKLLKETTAKIPQKG